MKDYFERAIEIAKSHASTTKTETLLTEEYYQKVFSEAKLTPPSIDRSKISVSLGSQVMSFNNVPNGLSFIPGEKMEYAQFEIPIDGEILFFEEHFKYLLSNNDKIYSVRNKTLYIKEFSQASLIDNDSAIDAVKSAARIKINHIIASLKGLKAEIESFNNDTLSNQIREVAKIEVDSRKRKDDTIEKLKLF